MRTSLRRIPLSLVAALALLLSGSAFADELVSNGGFETGNFTGWNLSLNFDPGFSSVDGARPHSGTFSADMGPVSFAEPPVVEPVFVSQNLSTVAGNSYLLNFWLSSTGPSAGLFNQFTATWNGANILPPIVNMTPTGYQLYSFTLTATTANTDLSFGFFNQPGFWQLDDVSVSTVSQVPEPTSMVLLATGFLGMAGAIRRKLQ